jgi:hypothetical protein
MLKWQYCSLDAHDNRTAECRTLDVNAVNEFVYSHEQSTGVEKLKVTPSNSFQFYARLQHLHFSVILDYNGQFTRSFTTSNN